MKLDCGLTRNEKRCLRAKKAYKLAREREEWHTWFAWRPVRVGKRDCRWLEKVERKVHYVNMWKELSYYNMDTPERFYTEYRAINE